MTKKHSARNGNILAGIHYGQWGGGRLRRVSGANTSTNPLATGVSAVYRQ